MNSLCYIFIEFSENQIKLWLAQLRCFCIINKWLNKQPAGHCKNIVQMSWLLSQAALQLILLPDAFVDNKIMIIISSF